MNWMDPKTIQNKNKIDPVYLIPLPQNPMPTAFSSTHVRAWTSQSISHPPPTSASTPPHPPHPKSGLVLGLTAQAWLSVSLNEKFNFLAIIDLVSVLHSMGNDLWPDCMMCIDPRLFILLHSLYFPSVSEPESVDSLTDNQSVIFNSTCRSQA